MKLTQLCTFAFILVVSSVTVAEGGGDRTFERMMVANDRAVENFLEKKENSRPEPVNNDKSKDQIY
ncbi:co-regulatory protein PtrA N-terminal domain-containing protein [Pseudomonas sp. TH31]|uniref:co-regulatory protein PtrA N-terminal domain-containing protein n=1 Tax=Pseudomonas sp. TH31 TaxID=2796396 RepID=UPI0019129ED2|nr:co-regulatory protein PtrA N-terminal domain-containing protein [Pseudomonas sp. TH31]MBK5417198.1 hypothetical protein [Pseudomonas sp. TH31]